MLQLHPRESFTVVRQLEDPFDTSTYYVRAVIRNAKSDALIETLDLVDKGNRRFSKSWLVPADVSGQGFWITILTTVYTDAGYTTKSENYGEKMETFLVQERYNANLGGIGVGPDINYKKIRKIVEEVVVENKQEMPEIPKVIEVVKEKVIVPEVNIPPFPSLDPLLTEIRATKKAIDDKVIPEPEKINLLPIIDKMIDLVDDLKSSNGLSSTKLTKEILGKLETFGRRLENLKVNVAFPSPKVEVEEDNKPQLDPRISRILGKKQL